jgi:hypothetical protein
MLTLAWQITIIEQLNPLRTTLIFFLVMVETFDVND